MPMSKRLTAEFLGTLWLVLAGCGSAVLSTAYPTLGIGFLGVSLAFGLAVLTAGYALGHISGGHFNPAVSIGLWAAKRFPANELPHYIIAQVLGAIAGAGILLIIATGKGEFNIAGGFASNGFADLSPGKYTALAAFVAEVVMSFFFLTVFLGATSERPPKGFAPIAVGLCYTLVHLAAIAVTNASINPARSTGPALFVLFGGGSGPISQLWLFWLAPILGALLAGFIFTWLSPDFNEASVTHEAPNVPTNRAETAK